MLTGPGTPPLLSLPAIGPINIFSRGVSKWGRGGCWRELGGGQCPLMIICSLLEHPANAFISRLSAWDPMQQPVQQTMLQAAKHIVTHTEYTHTHTAYTSYTFTNTLTTSMHTPTEGMHCTLSYTLKQHSDAHNKINQSRSVLFMFDCLVFVLKLKTVFHTNSSWGLIYWFEVKLSHVNPPVLLHLYLYFLVCLLI